MATEEIKYFNVKNTSIRLVHFGGVMILPEQVKKIVDDELGVNRASIENDIFLKETEEEETEKESESSEAAPAKSKSNPGAKSATGAGWNAKG